MLAIVPHLDDETFSLGYFLLTPQQPLNLNNLKLWKLKLLRKIKDYKIINGNNLIIVFCNGGRHNKKARLKVFKENCKEYNASYIILNYADENLYKKSLSVYIDILYYIFSQIDYIGVVGTVSYSDLHQEHFLVNKATKIACKKFINKICKIIEFKQPMENFDTSEYQNTAMETKRWKELCKRYKTETQPNKEPFFRIIYSQS